LKQGLRFGEALFHLTLADRFCPQLPVTRRKLILPSGLTLAAFYFFGFISLARVIDGLAAIMEQEDVIYGMGRPQVSGVFRITPKLALMRNECGLCRSRGDAVRGLL
jgi:hypothetical protein